MCCLLVSGFLTEITQQIHSLRASGVISSHFARATGSEMRTFRKSAGTLCTAPGEIAFLVMDFILHRYAISLESPRMLSELGRREKLIWTSAGETMGLLSASKREKILATRTRQLAFSRRGASLG
jgi:hypothetical protein